MKLFHWRSIVLRNYSDGHILALAPDVETARAAAQTAFGAWLTEERSWLDPKDAEDRDELAAFRETLDAELAKEPTVIDQGAILITGSE